MPLIKIYVKNDLADKEQNDISQAIQSAMITEFDVPKDDLFHLFLPYEDKQFLFDYSYGLPINKKRADKILYISILCGDGRSALQKERLYKQIVLNISNKTTIKPETIVITITETAKENWSFGLGISLSKEMEERT